MSFWLGEAPRGQQANMPDGLPGHRNRGAAEGEVRMFLAKILTSFVAVLFAIGITATAALAHVIVPPRESAVGASQTYTVRVPAERNTATVRIEAEFPAA